MLIAIIGGTGIDEMDFFSSAQTTTVSTRYGDADIFQCRFEDQDLIFLPRHGRDHSTAPDKINVRAQIAALKKCGAQRVIGVCAAGSLNAELDAGSFAVLTDFIDFTRRAPRTFFDQPGAPVVHTDFTRPYCAGVSRALAQACTEQGVRFEAAAVYLGVDGPRYETPAEIRLYSSWGAHVIGMTNVPEAVLAREAGLCYGAIAIVTNLAAGISPIPLTHADVRQAMRSSGEEMMGILTRTIRDMPAECECECRVNSQLVL